MEGKLSIKETLKKRRNGEPMHEEKFYVPAK